MINLQSRRIIKLEPVTLWLPVGESNPSLPHDRRGYLPLYNMGYDAVFTKIGEAGLKLKPSKCEFFKRRIAYLGHIVSDKGIETDPKKIEAIINWPVPKTVHDARSFLGFTNYYRKFIYKYAQKAKPLNKLISGENTKKKHSKVDWTDECQTAFEVVKGDLYKYSSIGLCKL